MDHIDFSKIYSFSKLNLFEQCPQAYHFTYLHEVYSKMKSQFRKDPSNIWPFNTLGKAVHDAITLFLYLPEKEKTLENLKEQLKASWWSEAMPQKIPPLGKWGGFKNLNEERQYYKKALKLLANFYKTFDQKIKIKLLPTRNIKRSIDDYKKLIKPVNDNFDISGKLDLVLDLNNGSLEVVDFKTGKSEEKDDFQLRFYKLLTELNFGQPVSKASFYYLRTGNIKEFNLEKDDLEKIKKEVIKKIKKIQAQKEYITKPSKLCRYCMFKTFCPAKKEVSQYIQEPLQEGFADDLPF